MFQLKPPGSALSRKCHFSLSGEQETIIASAWQPVTDDRSASEPSVILTPPGAPMVVPLASCGYGYISPLNPRLSPSPLLQMEWQAQQLAAGSCCAIPPHAPCAVQQLQEQISAGRALRASLRAVCGHWRARWPAAQRTLHQGGTAPEPPLGMATSLDKNPPASGHA